MSFLPTSFASRDTQRLESRLFNVIAVLCALTGFLLAISSLYHSLSPFDLILSLIVMFSGLGFYLSSIFLHNDQFLRKPLVLLLTGVLCITWFTNGGLDGSTPIYFMAAFIAIRILLEGGAVKGVLMILFVIVSILVVVHLNYPDSIRHHNTDYNRHFDIGVSLVICLFMAVIMIHLVADEYRNEKDKGFKLYQQTLKDKVKLEQAMAEIKLLKGILPLCSFCKKIRDENDEWHSLEKYFGKRSQVEFSHSFCPDCGEKHYGEYIGS